MRRLLPLVAAVLLIAPAAAQERAKNMLSVRGGATFAHLQVTLGSLQAATETRTGYHIEVADEVLLHRSLPLYVETGIGFTSAGGAYRGLAIRPMYLQVPLLLNVRIRLGRGSISSRRPERGMPWGWAARSAAAGHGTTCSGRTARSAGRISASGWPSAWSGGGSSSAQAATWDV